MYTNVHDLPISLVLWLAHDEYDHNPDPNTISVTSLLKPIKSLILGGKLQQEGTTDVSALIASRMGTAIHNSIEQTWLSKNARDIMNNLSYPNKLLDSIKINPDPKIVTEDDLPIYLEIRNSKDILGYTISGKFDFVCDGQVEDFKSTGTYSWVTGSNVGKYVEQGSIYRWLNPHIITNDLMRINYIFTDWNAGKARQPGKYPPQKVLSEQYPLMSIEDTEQFVHSKVSDIIKYLDVTQEEMPICTSEELWERPAVYKYYKNPEKKTRSTANFDNYWQAHERYVKDGSVGEVVTIKGEVVFCKYCPAAPICRQAETYVNEGRLNL